MTLRARRLPSGFWKGASGRKTTRRSKSTRAVKSLAPKARKAVATIAKKVFNRSTETKYIASPAEAFYTAIYGDTAPSGGAPPQLFTCLPQIDQGDTSYERQGLKINPSRHRTDLRIVFNNDGQITNPSGGAPIPASQAGWDITVHIWYGYVRRYKAVQDVASQASTILGFMFDDGHGSTQRFTGLLTDETLQLNKEFVSLKHKKVRMYKNAGLANVGDITAPSLSTPMSEAKRVSLVWKAPKTLVYEDEGAALPENYAPFYVIGYVHNDATQASNVTHTTPTTDMTQVSAIKVAQVDKLWYKDA